MSAVATRPRPEATPKGKTYLRQPGEAADQFELFAAYRDLPAKKRSVENVWRLTEVGKKYALTTLRALCTDFHWVQRAIAYDDFIFELAEKQERQERITALRKMRRRHREHGDVLMGKAMAYLRAHPKIESIKDATALVRLALELEQSGNTYDPVEAFVSGDTIDAPAEQQEVRKLAIEVFTTGGAAMSAESLRASLMAMYDQKPTAVSAKELAINSGSDVSNESEKEEAPATDDESGNQDEDLQPDDNGEI